MALLHWIVDKVIANRRARAFMLRSNVKHPIIEDLFDSRVLHMLKKGISTHDEPGARYDAYKLDYGCYVDLMTTSRAPMGLFEVNNDDDGGGGGGGDPSFVEVPVDDYRSIRRAILDLSEFEKNPSEIMLAQVPLLPLLWVRRKKTGSTCSMISASTSRKLLLFSMGIRARLAPLSLATCRGSTSERPGLILP